MFGLPALLLRALPYIAVAIAVAAALWGINTALRDHYVKPWTDAIIACGVKQTGPMAIEECRKLGFAAGQADLEQKIAAANKAAEDRVSEAKDAQKQAEAAAESAKARYAAVLSRKREVVHEDDTRLVTTDPDYATWFNGRVPDAAVEQLRQRAAQINRDVSTDFDPAAKGVTVRPPGT